MSDRDALRMSEDDVAEFLRSQQCGMVAGHDEAGVLVSRRAVCRHEDGGLRLALVPPARCFDLDGHPQLCYVVDVYPTYEEIKSVIVHGRGEWTDAAGATLRMSMDRVVSFDFSKQPG